MRAKCELCLGMIWKGRERRGGGVFGCVCEGRNEEKDLCVTSKKLRWNSNPGLNSTGILGCLCTVGEFDDYLRWSRKMATSV
jgi:hypothetical protein